MTLTDLFDRIAIINLPERQDRRDEIAQELSYMGLSLQSPGVMLWAAHKPEDAGGFPSRGARGAYISHLSVLKQAKADGVQRLLVMEDDLMIDPRLKAALPALAPALMGDQWDLVYLGHMGPSQPLPARLEPTQAPQQCLHCYAVHQRALDRLIDYLEACLKRPAGHPDGGLMHVDGAVSMFRARHPEITTWLLQPSMGSQRPSRSDITNNRWYDRLIVVRHLAAWARRLKARRLRGASMSEHTPT
jgi:GR25 family glycosyltransferase involved in LPS biosynthesis